MKILFVSPEVSPIARTGGLGDVVGSLPIALKELGLDVRILCPLHRVCREIPSDPLPKPVSFRLAQKYHSFAFRLAQLQDSEVPVYFLENNSFFDRKGIYSDEGGDFQDNALRAFALSKAAIELSKAVRWKPDVYHAHDWMAAPTCAYLNAVRRKLKRKVGSVLTVHNLEHQGCFHYDDFLDSHLPKKFWGMEGFEKAGQVNLLKGGIQHADKLTTVSPTYAQEIKTIAHGHGLEESLRYRAADLVGILNGIDENAWDPSNDTSLACGISKTSPEKGKKLCKKALQAELSLLENPNVPLFGVVSRLYEQKGLDLLLEILPSLLKHGNSQFVVLGSGDAGQEDGFAEIARLHPKRVAARIGFDDGLARRIFAGSDFFLMPSRFEPCGLAQQYAMRYGSIPIARKTGGLADTISSVDLRGQKANGFLFKNSKASELSEVIHKALALYEDGSRFAKIRENGMNQTFSWASAAQKYAEVYAWALR